MIIEFQNTIAPKNHSTMAVAIVITACAFFFVPTTLIILGYYASQPTGTLISPLPQGILSEVPSLTPPAPIAESETPEIIPSITPTQVLDNQPIIAADNTATAAATANVAPVPGSNITDKVATIEPGTTETVVKDPDVTESTAIYLSPRPEDKAIYSVKSKGIGEFTIKVDGQSDIVRSIDYHLVNP